MMVEFLITIFVISAVSLSAIGISFCIDVARRCKECLEKEK